MDNPCPRSHKTREKMENTGIIRSNLGLAGTLKLTHMLGAKNITGDIRYGEWCKMTNSYVALKDFSRGKWYRYYFNNYQRTDGEPDFESIAKMFYKESGCKPIG